MYSFCCTFEIGVCCYLLPASSPLNLKEIWNISGRFGVMKPATNISKSEDSHECIHHSRISPSITTVVMSLRATLARNTTRLDTEFNS